MLIRRVDETTGDPVEMDGVEGVRMRVLVGRADGAPTFALRRFTVDPGGHTPNHRHNYEHEVVVLEGAGRVEHEGETRPIRAGDVLFVEPNAQHQFVNDGDAPLVFLCLVPVSFDCGADAPAPVPGS